MCVDMRVCGLMCVVSVQLCVCVEVRAWGRWSVGLWKCARGVCVPGCVCCADRGRVYMCVDVRVCGLMGLVSVAVKCVCVCE